MCVCVCVCVCVYSTGCCRGISHRRGVRRARLPPDAIERSAPSPFHREKTPATQQLTEKLTEKLTESLCSFCSDAFEGGGEKDTYSAEFELLCG